MNNFNTKKMNSLPEVNSNPNTIVFGDFDPEIFDCEADGACSNGHIHTSPTTTTY